MVQIALPSDASRFLFLPRPAFWPRFARFGDFFFREPSTCVKESREMRLNPVQARAILGMRRIARSDARTTSGKTRPVRSNPASIAPVSRR